MDVIKTIKKIKTEFNENINSHVFLYETDDVEKTIKEIKEIIKEYIKADELTKKQIDEESYIENIIIRTEEKEIKKNDIIYLQERIKTKPVLSNRIFYIIAEAEKMNDIASNKLLKTIEEPNESIIGFLISKNISQILPTIKSRCEIEQLYFGIKDKYKEENEEIRKTAEEIIEIIETKKIEDFFVYKYSSKNAKDTIKEEGKKVANVIKDYYNTACNVQFCSELNSNIIRIIQKNNKQVLLNKTAYLNNTLNTLIKNMNSELLIDKIVLEIKEVES